MSDIKLFRMENGKAKQLVGSAVAVEKSLQNLIEQHMEEYLGVRFLATEYSTGKVHGGRIDSLGIDENGCPVIIEYKRSLNENVINQGLFYLDWLMDHKAEFKLLVMDNFGKESADNIEWSSPRLLCIAGDFTKYDEHAVQQINRNIELIRYRRYGDELLLLELVNATTAQILPTPIGEEIKSKKLTYKSVEESLRSAPQSLRDVYEALEATLLALGDDVQLKKLKLYYAFKRIKNFVCVEVRPSDEKLVLYLKVNPDSVELEEGFIRDVRNVGHWGTGDLQVTISSNEDLEKARHLLIRSYEES